MRIVVIGASEVAVAMAGIMLARHHEVVIIERDKEKIDSLAEELDCGFLHGDGSKPAILKEASPSETDALLCLTNHDQDNILASLVGRSLGFKRIVTKIEDPEFEHICAELGLGDTIIPDMNTANTLADMVVSQSATNLSSAIRNEARFFTFVVRERDEGDVSSLDLPKDAMAVLVYRGEEMIFANEDTKLVAGDEVVILTHSRNLPKLDARWHN